MKLPIVGILSFQGDFAMHRNAFERLGCKVVAIKSAAALKEVDYLVIPGGESSVIFRFIRDEKMIDAIKDFAAKKPVWGSCAGMILLGREINNDQQIEPLGLLDIVTARNAYGRQFDSFVSTGEFSANGKSEMLEMVFIRAPKIVKVGKQVEVLGRWSDEITIVRQGNVVATSFHPELTQSGRFQKYFLSLARKK
jgi:5'-phosphate synthase pdxT subunit